MSALFRFLAWPLSVKMAALLVVASVVPLAVAAFIDIRHAQQQLLANTEALLAARGDQLLGELDAFHRGYQLSVRKLARLPSVVEFSQAGRDNVDRLKPAVRGILEVHAASDPNLRGLAVLAVSGRVKIATEDRLVGKNLSYHGYIREALRGTAVISDIHLAEPEVGSTPTIAYLAPVAGPDANMIGLVVLWVRAKSLWDIAKASNELAGPGSFAVVLDRQGIRIAHTFSEDIVFHPSGRLAPATVDALVSERRFGEKTRALLEDVRAFPEQFDRARAESPDPGMFRGFAPVNRKWIYGVALRLETVPWTIFYMIPEESLNAQIAQMGQTKTVFAGVIILIALAAGTLFAAAILRPVRSLSTATAALASGDLAARVQVGHADELGRLGTSFNSMAEQIETHATALQKARDELELRVQERTTELAQLAAIVESSDDAIMGKTLNGVITTWNSSAERMFGYSRQEALGSPMLIIFPPDRFDEEPQILARIARGESIDHFETVRIRKDGKLIDVSVTISPIKDSSGRIVGASKIAREITERKHAEQSLQERAQIAALGADVGAALTRGETLQEMLQQCCEAIVRHLHAAFARIWTLNEREDMLELRASAGLYVHLDGPHGRVPVGKFKIGLIAQERKAHLTNQVVGDPRVGDQEWARREGMVAFAGYPLLVQDHLVGVAAMFSRNTLTEVTLQGLASISNSIALGIERKRAEEALRESEEKYRQMVDRSPDAVTIHQEGRWVFANPAAARILGVEEPSQLVGRSLLDFMRPDIHQQVKARWKQLYEDRQPVDMTELSMVRPDGTIVYLETSAIPVVWNGRPAAQGVARDITERKRAEEALRASEAQLRSFVDEAPAPIAMFDGNMICLAASRRWVADFGRGHPDLVGLNHYEVHPDMPEKWREIHRRGLAGEAQKCDEDLWIQADGTRNWLRWAVQPWRDVHGVLGGIMILAEDITQGKQIEEEVRETKNFLASIFDNIPNSIFIKDARDLRFVRVNPACEKLTGYPEKDFLGKNDYDFFPKEQADFFVAKDRETLAGSQRVFIVEESITSSDGTQKILQTKKFPILDNDGHPKFLLGMSEDITERKQAEEAIRQLNTDLERRVAKRTAELSAKNKELETFSYSVSHDLKAPLRGIDGYSRLLLSDYDSKLDEDGRSFLRNIRSATSQMQQLIDDLLAYSKLERRALSATRVDPCMAVEAILNERKHDLERTKLSVRLAPGAVRADPEGLAISLRNLIDNAVKFSGLREKPAIEIESHVEADRYIFSVRDNGAGFDMKYHDRIFQIFQRLHRSEDYSGTGIGLAIVRKAMDRMGGRVWAESEPDKGAVFFLDLPCDGLNGSSGVEDHFT